LWAANRLALNQIPRFRVLERRGFSAARKERETRGNDRKVLLSHYHPAFIR